MIPPHNVCDPSCPTGTTGGLVSPAGNKLNQNFSPVALGDTSSAKRQNNNQVQGSFIVGSPENDALIVADAQQQSRCVRGDANCFPPLNQDNPKPEPIPQKKPLYIKGQGLLEGKNATITIIAIVGLIILYKLVKK